MQCSQNTVPSETDFSPSGHRRQNSGARKGFILLTLSNLFTKE